MLGGRVVVFVSMKVPLAIVIDHLHDTVKAKLEEMGVFTVRVDDMDSASFRSDVEAVALLAGRPASDNVCWEQFSAADLVWATI